MISSVQWNELSGVLRLTDGGRAEMLIIELPLKTTNKHKTQPAHTDSPRHLHETNKQTPLAALSLTPPLAPQSAGNTPSSSSPTQQAKLRQRRVGDATLLHYQHRQHCFWIR